ncbi:spore cortex biosynthesis protein YabQ [Bacillus spongiae]|uniref:Spore cortex biosynthesis protein YabQ n=1 Tax=Bacillus spongiae TaxID=2683610 RepID=A0ABU8HJC4_9BACI
MSLTTQFYTMIAMIGMGGVFGAALDTYHRFLKRPDRSRWIVFIHDVLFWVVQGLLIFYVLYVVNFGEVRFYIFLALFCGFSAYQALFKSYYVKMLEFTIKLVIAVYRFCRKMFQTLIIAPIRWIITVIIVVVIGLAKFIYRLMYGLLKLLIAVSKILLSPLSLLIKIIWKLIPKAIKKHLIIYYHKLAGVFEKSKNTMIKVINRWKRKK